MVKPLKTDAWIAKPHNNNEKQERTIEIEITLIDKKNSYITRGFDC